VTDIFQEVEEEVRRERFEKLWKKYGNYFIAGAALVVIGVAGYQLWTAWDRSQRETASEKFHAAEQLAQSGRLSDAETAFAKLAQDAPSGYATLAKFNQASAMQAEGKRDAALALYTSLTQLPDPELSGAARLRIAWAQADYAPRADIGKTLAPLTGTSNLWRYAAEDVLAYVALRDGNRAAATDAYARLAAEANAPQGMRARAAAMAEYLRANPEGNFPAAVQTPANQGTKPK
jgi:hypothetical protein